MSREGRPRALGRIRPRDSRVVLSRRCALAMGIVLSVVGQSHVSHAAVPSGESRRRPQYPATGNINCPYLEDVHYTFPTNSGFTATQQTQIATAIAKWSQAETLGGDSFLKATPDNSGSSSVFQIVNGPLVDFLAYTHCDTNPKQIIIDVADLGTDSLGAVAVHEFGHAHGMSHAGTPDNTSSAEPVMATCHSFITTDLGVDDEAQALYRRTNSVSTANAGYERDLAYWSSSGASIVNGTGFQGTHYVQLPANGNFIQQEHVLETNGITRNFQVTFALKMAGGTTGGVNYKLYRTARNYPTI